MVSKTVKLTGIEYVRDLAVTRYGDRVKVIKSRPVTRSKNEYLVSFNGTKGWLTAGILRSRKFPETLFMSGQETKDYVYAQHSATHLEASKNRIITKLKKLGVDSEVTFIQQIGTGQKAEVFLGFRGQKVKVSLYFIDYMANSAKTLYRRLYAWTRFKSTVSITHTDKEWREKVEKASGGSITSRRFIPTGHGPQELFCLRCEKSFTKTTMFNTKNAIIRCPDCDSKQSKNYSTRGLAWLKDLEHRFSIKIRHAESKNGEAGITLNDGSLIHVDGLHKKIVFEYHGARWHGDPTQFYADEYPNPYDKKHTTVFFLRKTLNRELAIANAGYSLIRIWEADFISPERYNQWLLQNSRRLRKFLMPK